MGQPMLPEMPRKWLLKAEMRAVPGGDPGKMEQEVGFWIEELGAWIAESAEHAELLRDLVGPEARVMLGSDLQEEAP